MKPAKLSKQTNELMARLGDFLPCPTCRAERAAVCRKPGGQARSPHAARRKLIEQVEKLKLERKRQEEWEAADKKRFGWMDS